MGDGRDEARDETRDAIIDAVFTSICKHGYSDMTMQDIADELGKSTSLLHYYYGTKDELLDEFLKSILERMEASFKDIEGDTATERLQNVVERILFEMDDAEGRNVHRALVELRSVAPYREGYPERFRAIEKTTREQLEKIIREGVELGEFDVDDTELAAELVYEAFHGHIVEEVTSRFDEEMKRGDRIRRYIDMMLK